MTDLKQLETAIRIAINAHYGQEDKAKSPYIFHPFRVMNNVASIEEKIVAVLHDVVEDTNLTFEYLLNQGISPDLVDALRLLTHTKDTSYEDYIKKLSTNKIAKAVKLADIRDNRNLGRLETVTQKDLDRLEKYKRATKFLESI